MDAAKAACPADLARVDGGFVHWEIVQRYRAIIDGRDSGMRKPLAWGLMRDFAPADDVARPFYPGTEANRIWDETEGRRSA